MDDILFDWDDEDDSRGNTRHILDAGISPHDVELVIADFDSERSVTRKTKRPLVRGRTAAGDWIMVVYERDGANPVYIRPITAWYV